MNFGINIYDFDSIDPTEMIIDIGQKTRYTCDPINRITIEIDGHDILYVNAFIIAILIKVSTLIFFLDSLTIT